MGEEREEDLIFRRVEVIGKKSGSIELAAAGRTQQNQWPGPACAIVQRRPLHLQPVRVSLTTDEVYEVD